MCNMYAWTFICLVNTYLMAGNASPQPPEMYVQDVCNSETCATRSEEPSESLHMLQRGGRIKAARAKINTTELMMSDEFEGFQWLESSTTAACKQQAVGEHDSDRSLTLTACKSKCLEAGTCTALDFHDETGRCHIFTSQCEKPDAVKTGSSSFRLRIYMGSESELEAHSASPVFIGEPGQLSLGQQEPEGEAGEAGEEVSSEGERPDAIIDFDRNVTKEDKKKIEKELKRVSSSKDEAASQEDYAKALVFKNREEELTKKLEAVSAQLGSPELQKAMEEVEKARAKKEKAIADEDYMAAFKFKKMEEDLLDAALALKIKDGLEEAEVDEFENEYLMEQIVAAVSCSLIFVFIVTHIMEKRNINLLPEAAMIILQGVLLGLVMKYWADSAFMRDPVFRCQMSIELLNLVFLPLLMFESGWSVRRLDFISQFPYIMLFAVVGTLISTFVVGMLIYQSGQMGFHTITHYRGAFVIAALISTTDPVATLATYSHLKVDPLLNIIVFGEAAINDAVGIVVFSIVNDDETMSKLSSISDMLTYGTYKGLKIMSCSFFLGLLVSVIVCGSLKIFRMRENKKLEIMIVVVSCYLAFALGEFFEVSGIICTLFCGMLMGQYARPHLSVEGGLLCSFFISEMCMVMDAGVFLLSGVCCICLSFHGQQLGYCLMLFCAVGRICSTVPCGVISNMMKNYLNSQVKSEDRHILTPKYLFMIWHAGLRGGIAENLALQIGEWLDNTNGPGSKEAVRSAVFFLVATFIIVFGGTTKMFLQCFGIPMGSSYSEDALSKTELNHTQGRLINFLHNKFFFPLLVGTSVSSQDADVVQDVGDNDVLEVLHEVCHGHRGGCMRKRDLEVPDVPDIDETKIKR
mmetsp:Transcript_53804/g.98330  ORF Transcript_53804/g.98330 Transcript_53804/m.98330 type:complete len:863 (+) Transcript_53804:68-2656(+)